MIFTDNLFKNIDKINIIVEKNHFNADVLQCSLFRIEICTENNHCGNNGKKTNRYDIRVGWLMNKSILKLETCMYVRMYDCVHLPLELTNNRKVIIFAYLCESSANVRSFHLH